MKSDYMVRWQFSKTKFRICAFILGNIIGFMMFRYLWTDSYFVNKYCESLLIDRKFVQIKLDSMITPEDKELLAKNISKFYWNNEI